MLVFGEWSCSTTRRTSDLYVHVLLYPPFFAFGPKFFISLLFGSLSRGETINKREWKKIWLTCLSCGVVHIRGNFFDEDSLKFHGLQCKFTASDSKNITTDHGACPLRGMLIWRWFMSQRKTKKILFHI